MADIRKRVSEDVPGDFFVDTTCIDCDTCRQIAPEVFGAAGEYAYVHLQPVSTNDRRQALRALVSCPTGSIGTQGDDKPASVMDDFPLTVEGPVMYCGYTSPKSFGGSSYLIRRQHGNWLVDSPKFLPRLVQRITEMGGIEYIFLTHSDDVADAELYAKHFKAKRIIHRAELKSQPDAEFVLTDDVPMHLADDLLAIPTPGHTRGHCVLLFADRYLFTGDHLAWDRDGERLEAFRDYCWYSWERQTESMARLLSYKFEWVLPGHGQRVHLPAFGMRREMVALIERMRER